MPRPDTITAEDLARWDAQCDTFLHDAPGLGVVIEMAGRERGFYAGAWLGEELRRRGATDAQIDAITFAHGQRQFHVQLTRDPCDCWDVAVHVLARYDAGHRDTPGPELAAALLAGVETP